MNLPSGTVTFLFTDLEGSVQLWEQFPEAMRLAGASCHALLRQAIEAHHGVVFKTIGDAVCAAFPTASDAVAAALEAQKHLNHRGHGGTQRENQDTEESRTEALSAVSSESSVSSVVKLKVQMALHTGTADERDGDYFGPPLNRVARLLAIGHGGQVLLSDITRELTQDQLPAGAGLKNLGEHRLRDLTQPEQVFQLLHPELPVLFPPLKSLDTLPNNLPIQVTSFIGREQEMAEVKQLLQQTRLLTLTGSGGCGKTRLALQVAADLLETEEDGVWLVELATLSDPALVPEAVAHALGIPAASGQAILPILTDYLKTKRLLLILDNCEHLLNACARLADLLLHVCPKIKILASSREVMGIAGETTYRVPSLSVPESPATASVASLLECEAVRLFIERAQSVLPTFIVTPQSVPALARLCRRLDGIPLALELAAARMRALSLEQITTRLDDRFRFLTGGSRTALPRQQTLRALIDWSYDLLNTPEKTLFRRLSVFAGGWTLEAAEAIVGDKEGQSSEARGMSKAASAHASSLMPQNLSSLAPDDVLDLLTSLVDKSLVLYEETRTPGRYRLLETVRQYARDRLMESGEGEPARRRHRDWFLTLAEEAAAHLQSAAQGLALERLETEHDNLRAALDWSLEEPEEAEAALRFTECLSGFWEVRGYFAEARHYYAAALARPGAQVQTTSRAVTLNALGNLLRDQGGYDAARAHYEESRAILRELGDKPALSFLLNNLGIMADYQCDYPAARAYLEESLALCRALGNASLSAYALNGLGLVAGHQGDYKTARSLYEESLGLLKALGDTAGIAYTLDGLGNVALYRGDLATARSHYAESLALLRELGDKTGIAYSLGNLGSVALAEGDTETARLRIEESLSLESASGDRRGIAESQKRLGDLSVQEGHPEQARAFYAESLKLYRALGDTLNTLVVLEACAAPAVIQAQPARAVRLYSATERVRQDIGAPRPSIEQSRYTAQIAMLRAALDEEEFAAAWTGGQAWTLEQAVGFALTQAGNLSVRQEIER